jgi:hypothetical protein
MFNNLSRKSCRLRHNVKKMRCSHRPQMTIWRMRVEYGLRLRACAPTCTHTQTYVIVIAFPRQELFCERPSMLRYTYTACLVFFPDSLYTEKPAAPQLCQTQSTAWHNCTAVCQVHILTTFTAPTHVHSFRWGIIPHDLLQQNCSRT